MPRSNDALDVGPASSFSSSLLGLLLLFGLGMGRLLPSPAVAQRAPGAVNVGLQVGDPGGVTAKLYRSRHRAYTALFTTDGDGFTLFGHRLHERPLPDSLLHLYAGPGLVVGTRTLAEKTPTPNLGLSVQVGLNFYAQRFEVFLELTPVLRVLPTFDPDIGGSVGLRYRLRRP
jgi:hypothetical protein